VAAWKHLPDRYHGRAGTVVVSGTAVARPSGHRRDADGEVRFGPSARLDLEAEVGVVVGVPSDGPVPLQRFADHAFGVVLVDDWSARDVQAFEYVPLGPFLGKAFATSVSAWVVPLAALEHARTAPVPRDVRPAAHLDDDGTPPWGLGPAPGGARERQRGVAAAVRHDLLDGGPAARAPVERRAAAHRRPAGLGTVSGPGRDQRGCLLELTRGGTEPVHLDDGSTRTFLQDGDEVVVTATAPGPAGAVVGLGEVRARVLPARG
jgi:fumarylacetoacetase